MSKTPEKIYNQKDFNMDYPFFTLASQGFLIEHDIEPTKNLSEFEKRRAVELKNNIDQSVMNDLNMLKKITEKS